MVTLSCLIVVAALFSQVSSTIPSSPTPKSIDYYFFYFIWRLFFIFLHNTILFLLTKYRECKEKKLKELETQEIKDRLECEKYFKLLSAELEKFDYKYPRVSDIHKIENKKSTASYNNNWMENGGIEKNLEKKKTKKSYGIDDIFNIVFFIVSLIMDIIVVIDYVLGIRNGRMKMYKKFYGFLNTNMFENISN